MIKKPLSISTTISLFRTGNLTRAQAVLCAHIHFLCQLCQLSSSTSEVEGTVVSKRK